MSKLVAVWERLNKTGLRTMDWIHRTLSESFPLLSLAVGATFPVATCAVGVERRIMWSMTAMAAEPRIFIRSAADKWFQIVRILESFRRMLFCDCHMDELAGVCDPSLCVADQARLLTGNWVAAIGGVSPSNTT